MMSTKVNPQRQLFRHVPDTSEWMDESLMPWNLTDTLPGEKESWESLHYDVMYALDDGVLTREEARWYVGLMAEMFNGEVMRTPHHVLMARWCFLHYEPGEA